MTGLWPDPGAQVLSLSDGIRQALKRLASATSPVLDGVERSVPFDRLAARFWIDAAPDALAGRTLLVSTRHPINAALALASLDGLACRLVLRPPDLADHHLPRVIAEAGIDGVVHDGAGEGSFPAD